MKLYIKVIIGVVIVSSVAAVLISTPPGKKVLGQLLFSSGGFSALIEKEKKYNINKKIDLTLPVNVDGYDTKLGNFMAGDTLILAVTKSCPPCEGVIKQVADQNDFPFIALSFNNAVLPVLENVKNKSMVLATTSLQPENFYMDANLSPVIFHVDSLGVIKKKYIGLNEERILQIASEIKE